MTILRTKSTLVYLLTLLLAPALAQAYISSENFDTNWVPTLPQTSFTNGTNLATGWISFNTRIGSSAGSNTPPYSANLNPNGWVQSPTLSNGAGTIYFYARGSASAPGTGVVEICTDDVNWTTNGSLSIVTGATFLPQTNVINASSSVKVRLRRISSINNWYVDTVDISEPPLNLSITNITTSPALPADNDPVNVSANINLAGSTNLIAATNYWREWPGTSWTAIPMATNASGKFETSTSITGKPAGTIIEYFVAATSIADGTPYANSSSTRSYTVRLQSGYTNMTVTGQLNTNLLLGANNFWQNVITLSNSNSPSFRFQGHSNAIATVWGDLNPTSSNVPAYGTADVNATNIVLAGSNTGSFVIGFNDSTRAYTIMACDAINFDSWTNASYNNFANFTNNGWIVTGGSTTNDTARSFSGRSLVLNGQQGGATNTYLLSPPQSNGIGQISFWYRNWATDASPAASFTVQVSTNPASGNWTPIATVTNIISPNYLFFSVGSSDRDNLYVRILNNPNGNTSRLCIDDVVIARPGAAVTAVTSNSPANPTVLDTVVITAVTAPQSGGVATNMILWYRMGTDGPFVTTTMTNTSGTIWDSAPIPRAAPGTVQYAIQCYFTGFQSESASPIWLPSAGTNNPSSYQVIDPSNNRAENFDTNWIPSPNWSVYQSGTNPATGWTINNARLNSAYKNGATGYGISLGTNGISWVQSPVFSNGVGSINFYSKRGSTDTNPVLVQISYDDTTFTTITNLSVSTSYQPFNFQINSLSNMSIRIQRTNPENTTWWIDDIIIPYPAADVVITNVFINPGYPSTSDTVTVSCDVSSINPSFPVWFISPSLYYRKANTSTFTALPMARTSGTTYSTTPFTIPAQLRDTTIQYYIKCDFKGYYGVPADNRSPRLYPSGGSNAPSSYTVRQFASSFSNVTAVINGQTQTARLLDNRSWQAVANLGSATNSLSISFLGNGNDSGSGYATNPLVWGNSNSWQTALPLADTAGTNQSAFSINGSFAAGQYLLRIDESSGQYFVIPCVWQDFDSWGGTAGKYVKSENANAASLRNTFDSWTAHNAKSRFDDFNSVGTTNDEGTYWSNYTNAYTNAMAGGNAGYLIYGAKISTTKSVQTDPTKPKGQRWVAQMSDEGNPPLRGIDSITYSYRPFSTNAADSNTVAVYLFPTNAHSLYDYVALTAVGYWTPAAGLTNHILSGNKPFVTNTISLKTNDSFIVIFSHDTGTNSILFDDITVNEWYSETITNAGYYAEDDLETWTSPSFLQVGTFTNTGWVLSNGSITNKSTLAYQGTNAAVLNGSPATNQPSFFRAPTLYSGVGDVSFWYRNWQSDGSPSATIYVQTAPSSTSVTWTTVATISSITATNYTFFSASIGDVNKQGLRILNNPNGNTARVLIDNVRITNPADIPWVAANAYIEPKTIYPFDNVCRLEASRANPFGSDQYLQSPLLTNGIHTVSFEYNSGANSNVTFDIQIAYETPTSWTNLIQVTNTAVATPGSNYTTVSYTFLRPPTNAYLRIKNTTPKPGALLLNSVSISPYVQGSSWRANNAAIDDFTSPGVRQFYANAGYLNSNRTSNLATEDLIKPDTNTYPYIRTPQISGGVGEISFWYRNWAVSGTIPPAKIVIQSCLTDSTNNTDWTTIGILNNIVNTNDYLYFRTSVYDTVSQYVRIYNDDLYTNKTGRVCLDDILITAPFASTLSMSNLVVTPAIPLYTNTVHVMVDVYHLFLAPSNITLQATYGVATNYADLASAPLSNLTMSCIASNLSAPGKWYRYKSTTAIPTNAVDTFVKYFTKATFNGYHTSGTSPKTNKVFGIYPHWYDPMNAVYGTNQAYYVVYSCPTGSVWFNEINYVDNYDQYDKQYVELCGKAGVNITNWSIEIRDASDTFVANYSISTNFILQNETNGHGFWVLGKSTVSNVDQILTNQYSAESPNASLPGYNGGRLSLRRSWGAAEDRVSYEVDSSSAGYPFISDVDYGAYDYGTIGLRGSGTNRNDFAWGERNGQTPGYLNADQRIFTLSIQVNDPPIIVIASFWVNTNVWIRCNTTNNWFPVPWYTTNLMTSNSWMNVPVFNSSIVNTNCTINFTKPTNSTTYFYMIEATNSP